VIPFKASAKGLFQGIVHDSSQSGQTVFFEPEELVYLNNEVKMAELEVEREVARILAELSGRVAGKEEELLRALSCSPGSTRSRRGPCSRRALRRRAHGNRRRRDEPSGCPPPAAGVERAAGGSERSAPGRPYLCLILTGPNAGGKTVALKTLGLLTLMAMAGLSIPASPDSTVSVFHRLFRRGGGRAERGGRSFHLLRPHPAPERDPHGRGPRFDGAARRGRLGDGSARGAAIARAFLETLADREVRVAATTHFEELKGIAFTDPRFENGSMAFDGEHLRPTYRLSLGVPGRSMGMEIARSSDFRTRSWSGRRGISPARTEPAGGDRPPGAGARAGARRSGGACGRRREAEEAARRLDASLAKMKAEESRVISAARLKMREEVRKAEGELDRVTEEMRKDRKIDTVRKASS